MRRSNGARCAGLSERKGGGGDGRAGGVWGELIHHGGVLREITAWDQEWVPRIGAGGAVIQRIFVKLWHLTGGDALRCWSVLHSLVWRSLWGRVLSRGAGAYVGATGEQAGEYEKAYGPCHGESHIFLLICVSETMALCDLGE